MGEKTGKRPWNYKGWHTTSRGQRYIHVPNHPYSTKPGYVLEHRLIVEKVINRFLVGDECVHHINEVPSDNLNSNLVLCPDNAYHRMLHRRKNALLKSSHANWLICRYCKKYDDPKNMIVYMREEGGVRAWHRECCRIASFNKYHADRINAKYYSKRKL